MAFAESIGEPPPTEMSMSQPDFDIMVVASRMSWIGLYMINVRCAKFALLNLRVLFNLVESTSVHVIQLLLNVLDYWCLLVERSARNNECFCTSEL